MSAPVLPEPEPPNFMSGLGHCILPRQRPSKLICWLIFAASLASGVALQLPAGGYSDPALAVRPVLIGRVPLSPFLLLEPNTFI